jgi:hypothetical protein
LTGWRIAAMILPRHGRDWRLQMVESKRDRFVRLAEKRTNSVIERIRVLSNCANPYAYEYGEDDVRRMFLAIDKELKSARAKFESSVRNDKFTLS